MHDFSLPIDGQVCRFHVAVGGLAQAGPLLVHVGDAPAAINRVLVVADDNVMRLYGDAVMRSLAQAGLQSAQHVIPPGESSKSLEQLGRIYDALAQNEIGRDGVVLAVGGGVVSDLAGLAAATWKRGVRFAICPTTLEAMIDAAIGGKTAINLPAGKNLVGAFHQPILVVVDPDCLSTLEPRDVAAGLAESVKHALITSEAFLQQHEAEADAIRRLEREPLAALIRENIRIKTEVVAADPRELSGRRMVLNFGHTVGHAIEACPGFALRHGECVALGMVAALRIGESLELTEPGLRERVVRLLERFELPTRLTEKVAVDSIMLAIRQDKKNVAGRVRMVLLQDVGQPVIRDEIDEGVIRAAIAHLLPG